MDMVTSQSQLYFAQIMGQEHGPYDMSALAAMVQSGNIQPDTLLRANASGSTQFLAKNLPGLFSPKEWIIAILLSVLVGGLGVDRFYVGHVGLGVLKLITCGGVGIWALIDIVLFALRKVNDSNGLPLR